MKLYGHVHEYECYQKSKYLTPDSILFLVFFLSTSGVGKKSQKFQNCLKIMVIIFNFSGVNLEGCNHRLKCGQKMSKFWLNLGVGKCSIHYWVASGENWELKFATWMAPALIHRIPKNCTEISKLGQNTSSQNSKNTQIKPLKRHTSWPENASIFCKYAVFLPEFQCPMLIKQLKVMLWAKYE